VDVPGVALRDQQIGFDVTPTEARAASAAQRGRLLDTVRGLDEAQWRAQSRCADWSIQDVVLHLTQMSDVMQAGIAAARADEKFTPFKTFDPKVTPTELVRAAGSQDPAVTVAEFARTTQSLTSTLVELGDDDSLLLVSPAGRQPWPRSILHALFDSAVHERDITRPLGLDAEPSVDEVGAIAAYQVLLASRVACMFGMSYAVELALEGAPVLTVRVDGPAVEVIRAFGTGAPVATGDAIDVLDAMTGRGELSDALDAPSAVIAGLSTLRSLV
jgi:uncharacterized protein (TIGR03083 family)